MKKKTELQFNCPHCRSTEFYRFKKSLSDHHARCRNCMFSWPAEDDWKYLRHAVVTSFESREEYLKTTGRKRESVRMTVRGKIFKRGR